MTSTPPYDGPELVEFTSTFRSCSNLSIFTDAQIDRFAELILHGALHMHMNESQLIRASLAIHTQVQLRQAKRLDASNAVLQKRVLLLTVVAVGVGVVQIIIGAVSLFK